ncbi:MAG: acyl-CoA dehydrogenase family protein [Myxococcota bacterium]
MANFLKDNEDLCFYMDRGINWDPLVRLTERETKDPDGFTSTEDAVAFYREVLESIAEFVAEEIDPHTEEIDRGGVNFVDGEVSFPPRLTRIFDQIKQLGFHGLCVPRELGGLNLPLIAYMASVELFSRADVSAAAHFGFHGGIAMAMLVYSINEGTTEIDPQTGEILSTRFAKEMGEIITGEAWGSMDITEPDAGSDMGALRCKGYQVDDGSWRVDGEKIFITSGHGKYHFAIARTEEAAGDDPFAGLKGLSMFMVPSWSEGPKGARTQHVFVDRIEEKLGHHGSATCTVRFDDAPAHLIGKRGDGFKHMLLLMNNARIGVSFESIGLCESALRLSKAYAAERRSMGKTIDQHEMIADMLDEMAVDIAGLRAIAFTAAEHEEKAQKAKLFKTAREAGGLPVEPELLEILETSPKIARRLTPLSKLLASEKAVEMARKAIQIHGGSGYIREYGAEKLLRDAMVFPIYEGTSQIQGLMAMKDALAGIMKRPADFLKRIAQARVGALPHNDPDARDLARLQLLSLTAQQHLIGRVAADKVRAVVQTPVQGWWGQLTDGWDPKRDFARAMLHAERLGMLLADEAIAEILHDQATRFPERQELYRAYMERALPRARHLHERITTTGAGILTRLHGEQ